MVVRWQAGYIFPEMCPTTEFMDHPFDPQVADRAVYVLASDYDALAAELADALSLLGLFGFALDPPEPSDKLKQAARCWGIAYDPAGKCTVCGKERHEH